MEAIMQWESYVLVGAVFVIAGLVKGVVGLGLPTIAMGLLTLLLTPVQAAALLIVPSLVTNIWQALPVRNSLALWKQIGPMQCGVFAGTLITAIIAGVSAGPWAPVLLGVALVLYACWGLWGVPPVIGVRTQVWLGPVVGTVTGVMTAFTGVFVLPAVPYLQGLQLSRDRLIQAMGISFTVSTIALALGLWLTGRYTLHAAGWSFVMLIPAIAGMVIGQALRNKMSPLLFKRCFFISLALLGCWQVIHSI
jgi:uncharacterized membrane protein YfcA